jgi:hypothetical protein
LEIGNVNWIILCDPTLSLVMLSELSPSCFWKQNSVILYDDENPDRRSLTCNILTARSFPVIPSSDRLSSSKRRKSSQNANHHRRQKGINGMFPSSNSLHFLISFNQFTTTGKTCFELEMLAEKVPTEADFHSMSQFGSRSSFSSDGPPRGLFRSPGQVSHSSGISPGSERQGTDISASESTRSASFEPHHQFASSSDNEDLSHSEMFRPIDSAHAFSSTLNGQNCHAPHANFQFSRSGDQGQSLPRGFGAGVSVSNISTGIGSVPTRLGPGQAFCATSALGFGSGPRTGSGIRDDIKQRPPGAPPRSGGFVFTGSTASHPPVLVASPPRPDAGRSAPTLGGQTGSSLDADAQVNSDTANIDIPAEGSGSDANTDQGQSAPPEIVPNGTFGGARNPDNKDQGNAAPPFAAKAQSVANPRGFGTGINLDKIVKGSAMIAAKGTSTPFTTTNSVNSNKRLRFGEFNTKPATSTGQGFTAGPAKAPATKYDASDFRKAVDQPLRRLFEEMSESEVQSLADELFELVPLWMKQGTTATEFTYPESTGLPKFSYKFGDAYGEPL